MRSSRWAVAYL